MSGDIDRDAELLKDESHYPEHLRTPPEKVLSANQLIAFNMWRARRGAAWSQQEVAELLEKYTGRSWSNASVSAAERSWQGGRPRKFDANEILALTKIFDQPIAYFFLPPEDARWNRSNVGMREFPDERPNMDPDDKDHDLMALIPTADYVASLGLYKINPALEFRMQELALRHLGLSWEPPKWKMPFAPYVPGWVKKTPVQPVSDVDVLDATQATSFTMNKEDLREFLNEVKERFQQHSAELAERAAEEVAREIMSRQSPPEGGGQE